MNDREKIGNRIREIRMKKGLTSEQLARMSGLKQQSISRIEFGKFSTGIDILGKIAKALDCDIEVIEKSQ